MTPIQVILFSTEIIVDKKYLLEYDYFVLKMDSLLVGYIDILRKLLKR